jgi:membrane protein
METLLALDWVGRLAEEDERYVLLVSPSETGVAPLAQQLLLPSAGSTEPFWQASHWATLRLADALPAR